MLKAVGKTGMMIISMWVFLALFFAKALVSFTAESPTTPDDQEHKDSQPLGRSVEETILSKNYDDINETDSFHRQWQDTCQHLLSGERKPIRFPHFHKVGGTTVCRTALRYKEKVGKGGNCNTLKDNAQALIGQSKKAKEYQQRSCDQRWESIQKLSFTAMETFLEEHTCPHMFHYVVMVRPPLDRMRSHLNSHQMDAKETVNWLKGGKKPSVKLILGGRIAFFDNYYIRFLLGPDVFFLPPFSITRNHLEQAKQKLKDTFAVVIPLYHQEVASECLQVVTRWQENVLRQSNSGKHKASQDSYSLKYLDELNALDVELYEYALTIAAKCKSHLINHVNRYFPNNEAVVR